MKKNNKLSLAGFTLIELVTTIVVLGLAIPVLLTSWANVAWRANRSEVMADATYYAQQLMEEIKSKRFDENEALPWTSSASFGVDTGESSASKATFDDIDDFSGATDANVTAPASGYTRSASIDYVRLNGSNWTTCGATVCNSTADCTLCGSCCYKRIRVSVSRADNAVSNLSLTTIMSGY